VETVNRLIRKVHIYAGLLVFAQLILYGLAGLVATMQAQAERPKVARDTRYVPFTAPPSSTDQEVAQLVYETLNFPLSRPIPDWFLRRTPDHHLLLDFYNINGIRRVVVLENEGRLRIEDIHNNLWLFLEDIHASTPGDEGAPPLMHIWALWNEAGMWVLLGFCVSGVWLWLTARPRFLWAWVSLVCGASSLAILWGIFR
jgi:uncharacterized iron-regulated membrane protein